MLSVHKPLTIMQIPYSLTGLLTVADHKLLFQVSGCRELAAACSLACGDEKCRAKLQSYCSENQQREGTTAPEQQYVQLSKLLSLAFLCTISIMYSAGI
jgi:hypothetical protein